MPSTIRDSFRSYLAAGLILLLSCTAISQDGGYPGAFLDLTWGSRAFGMGGTACGLVDDASSVFINPGMVGIVYNLQLSATMSRLTLDRSYYDLAFIYPVNGWLGNIGLGWTQFSIDNITGRDNYGFTTHKFSDAQSAFFFTFAKMFGERLSLGISAKYLHHGLEGYSARGMAWDGGIAFFLNDYIIIGAALQNLASSLTWNTESGLSEKLPMNISTGFSYYEPLGLRNMIIATDMVMTGGTFSGVKLGAEYIFRDLFIIRTGYNGNGITFGGGVMYKGLKLDAAYIPEPFSNSNRIQFTLNFYFFPGDMDMVEAAPVEEDTPDVEEPVLPEPEEPEGEKSVVLITDGPLKFEKAEVIRINVANNTIVVRLLAVPGAAPITLNMDQVQFIQ